jgi:acetyltransferase-like isoleucine patch superfamily enzyme
LCAGCGIVIGDGVLIGAGALIIDNDFHSWDGVKWVGDTISGSKAIYVHDYVFIGARAIILKGVTLGTGAVVGAGAVVAKDVAPFTIVGGNPARVIGRRS